QGNANQAAQHFAKALELDSAYGEAVLGLGKAYSKLKRSAEAVPLFRRATQLLPGRVEPYNWLGRTLIQLGQTEEGRNALEEVKRLKSAEHNRTSALISPTATNRPQVPQ